MNRVGLIKYRLKSTSTERLIQYSVRCYASTNASREPPGFNVKDTMDPNVSWKGWWQRLRGKVSSKQPDQGQGEHAKSKVEAPSIQELSHDVAKMRMAVTPDKNAAERLAQKTIVGVKKVAGAAAALGHHDQGLHSGQGQQGGQGQHGGQEYEMQRGDSTRTFRNSGEDYDKQQKKLGRPISPHMTIYRPQITWVLSLMHRFTGIVSTTLLYSLGAGAMLLPHHFPYYVKLLSDLQIPGLITYTFKFLIAWSFVYHTLNGVRHLAWDTGYGFEMPVLFKTGVAVLIGSTVGAIYLASI